MTEDRAAKARRERHETPTEQLDRNWSDLLQELRVVQTGVQLLTGLLFTAVFQSRFAGLSGYEHTIYLITVCLSALATALLIAAAITAVVFAGLWAVLPLALRRNERAAHD